MYQEFDDVLGVDETHPSFVPINSSGKCCHDTGRGYVCTREPNHEGLHGAHGTDKLLFAVWDDDK